MKFRTWGGARKGAGRRPREERAGVSHRSRAEFPHRFPIHVTVRMKDGVWGLRSRRCFAVLARAFWGGGDQFGFRLVHYSVMGNHIHLLAEARGKQALARGMKGLGVRVARGLNRLMQRRGRVLGDRYHARILRSPTEVRRVRSYLANNARRHYGRVGPDPFASQAPLFEPGTHLVRLLR
jgi:REP-associated tyrosine transposase